MAEDPLNPRDCQPYEEAGGRSSQQLARISHGRWLKNIHNYVIFDNKPVTVTLSRSHIIIPVSMPPAQKTCNGKWNSRKYRTSRAWMERSLLIKINLLLRTLTLSQVTFLSARPEWNMQWLPDLHGGAFFFRKICQVYVILMILIVLGHKPFHPAICVTVTFNFEVRLKSYQQRCYLRLPNIFLRLDPLESRDLRDRP